MGLKHEIAQSDRLWKQDQVTNGWTLPPPAPLILRMRPFRWVRGFVNALRVHCHAAAFERAGIGFGGPNQYDCWVLYAIWRGWC